MGHVHVTDVVAIQLGKSCYFPSEDCNTCKGMIKVQMCLTCGDLGKCYLHAVQLWCCCRDQADLNADYKALILLPASVTVEAQEF